MEILFVILTMIVILWGVYFLTRRMLQFFFDRNPQDHLTRYFKRFPDIRLEQVNNVSNRIIEPPLDFSAWEMVATFAYMLSKEIVSDTLRAAISFGDQGWEEKYRFDFFDKMEQTARAIALHGKGRDARDLGRLGQRIAKHYMVDEWEERFASRLYG